MRVGVIGRGFGERVVAPAFQAVDGSEVVDVVSPRDAVAVDSLCRRTDVDLIAVHSPPFLHLEHVRRAVEGGHDVLCDKPFGRSAGEAAEMRDVCPLNAAGPALEELDPDECWTVGPIEERLAMRQAAVDGGEGRRVALRSMFSGARRHLPIVR